MRIKVLFGAFQQLPAYDLMQKAAFPMNHVSFGVKHPYSVFHYADQSAFREGSGGCKKALWPDCIAAADYLT